MLIVKNDVSEHYWQPYRPYQQPVDNSAPQIELQKSAPASTVSSTTQPDQNADNVIKNTDIKSFRILLQFNHSLLLSQTMILQN